MKKLVATLLILCSVLFAACNFPFEDVTSPDIEPEKYTVYVFGAVENEGFFVVEEGADIQSVLLLAKPVSDAVYAGNPLIVVTEQTKQIAVNYALNGKTYNVVNVNGYYVTAQKEIANVSSDVVRKIAEYIEQNGNIKNKNQLKDILDEQEYLENYYKFYVSVDDYEEID